MSLINDALRRAKEAQQDAPVSPSAELPFRPVEPAQQRARRGLGLLMPAALAVVALLVLLVAWAWTQTRGGAVVTEVHARTTSTPQTIIPATTPAVQPAPAQEPASIPLPSTAAAAGLAGKTTPSPADEPIANVAESDATNAPAVATVLPPKPAPLRLQAIIFNPTRPSAMIAGKTLFVGDKLGDMRVVAIDKDSAVLAGAGQTNVLSLAE